VKYLSTPFTGGASAIGLLVSMTVFPSSLPVPTPRSASSTTLPFTASTMISPKDAVSAKVPTAAFPPVADFSAPDFEGSFVPIMTSYP